MARPSIDQLNEALADHLEDFLPALIGGEDMGDEWVADSTRRGGLGDSLTVRLKGRRRGKWYHHGAGVGGDPLGLINYAWFGNADMKGAYARAIELLGGKLADDTEDERKRRAARRAAAERDQKREDEIARRRARGIYFGRGVPIADGAARTPAWHYLDNRLGGLFASLGHVPGCFRFVEKLHNGQLDRELPALVTSIVAPDGDMVAMHRTWLVKRGTAPDSWDRLRADDVGQFRGVTADRKELAGKKVLGKFKGCSIRLWPGERFHERTGEIKRGQKWSALRGRDHHVVLTEGIETGLSVVLALRKQRRVVCVIAVQGFAGVVLPPVFGTVTIAADRDPGNTATAKAIERAELAHSTQGRLVRVVYPPPGFDDWNDVLSNMREKSDA